MANAAAAACGVPMPPAAPSRTGRAWPWRRCSRSRRASISGSRATSGRPSVWPAESASTVTSVATGRAAASAACSRVSRPSLTSVSSRPAGGGDRNRPATAGWDSLATTRVRSTTRPAPSRASPAARKRTTAGARSENAEASIVVTPTRRHRSVSAISRSGWSGEWIRLTAHGPSGSAERSAATAASTSASVSPAAPNAASTPARPSAVTSSTEPMPLAMAPAMQARRTPCACRNAALPRRSGGSAGSRAASVSPGTSARASPSRSAKPPAASRSTAQGRSSAVSRRRAAAASGPAPSDPAGTASARGNRIASSMGYLASAAAGAAACVCACAVSCMDMPSSSPTTRPSGPIRSTSATSAGTGAERRSTTSRR